jgi:chaperonin cofactor prefoldin
MNSKVLILFVLFSLFTTCSCQVSSELQNLRLEFHSLEVKSKDLESKLESVQEKLNKKKEQLKAKVGDLCSGIVSM